MTKKVTESSLEGTIIELNRRGRNILLTIEPNRGGEVGSVELPAKIESGFELIPYAQALLDERVRYNEKIVKYQHEYCNHFTEMRCDTQRELEILSGKLKGETYKC